MLQPFSIVKSEITLKTKAFASNRTSDGQDIFNFHHNSGGITADDQGRVSFVTDNE